MRRNPLTIPQRTGLLLWSKDKHDVDDNEPVVVHGSFLLPVYSHDITRAESASRQIVADIPIAFLVSGSQQGYIGCIRLQIPAKEMFTGLLPPSNFLPIGYTPAQLYSQGE